MSDNIVRFRYDLHLLPQEVVVEILIRLPTKSLIKFKSVSKSWCSLIASPQFLVKHLLPADDHDGHLLVKRHDIADRYRRRVLFSFLSNQTLIELSMPHPLPYPELPTSFPIEPVDIEMMGACNGLVCLFDSEHKHIVLWSLADGEIKVVPDSNLMPGYRFRRPDLGFGYDAESEDHKVIRMRWVELEEDGYAKEMKIEIYSFKTDSWKCIDPKEAKLPPGGLYQSVACANGVFLWLDRVKIIWFRMSGESFGATPLPMDMGKLLSHDGDVDPEDAPRWHVDLFVLNDDNIALVGYDQTPRMREKCFHVWVLLEFGVKDSWTRLYSVGPLVRIQRPLWIWKSGKIVMESNDGQLVLCDPFSSVTESLNICGVRDSFQIISAGGKYMAMTSIYRSHG